MMNNAIFRIIVTWIILQVALLSGPPTISTPRNGSRGSSSGILAAAIDDSFDHLDWGSFYDPKKIFCGKYDCYKILGFDYWTFDKVQPTLKDITKSYRSLSRKFHPDKNKEAGAKERFVMIARAYEVLTNSERKKEYDFFRDHPDEYLSKYGSSVIWKYAPQSDVRLVIILFFIGASLFSWYVQQQRWNTVANHIIKAAVEDWGRQQGGSTESAEIRKEALEILQKMEEEEEKKGEKSNGVGESVRKKKGPKVTKKEKKKEQQDELRKIVTDLVHKIDDFGGGFRKPTYRDIFVVKFVFLPATLYRSVSRWTLYGLRRLRGLPYSQQELEDLTISAVGIVAWDSCTEEEKEDATKRELWVTKNLEEWKEEREMKLLSAGERKRIARSMKKTGSKID